MLNFFILGLFSTSFLAIDALPVRRQFMTGGSGSLFFPSGGPGACGVADSANSLIVAHDAVRFSTSQCGCSVEVVNTQNGRSVKATVEDSCPSCTNVNSLALTPVAFDAIATQSEGSVPIQWEFLS